MRPVTVVVIAALCAVLGAVALLGLGVFVDSGELSEQWVSDTARDNELNHHAVGVGPDGSVVVTPVSGLPNSDTTITDTSCALVRLDPENGSTLWRVGVPAEDCFLHALTEPAIGDIDDDSTRELAVSTTQEALVVRDASDGSEQFRVPQETYGYARPTIADVHPREGSEVVATDIGGNVVAAHADGSVAWRTDVGDQFDQNVSVWARPVVADVDADGDDEVTIGTNKGFVVLTAATGAVEWHAGDGAAYLVVTQADVDPAREILTADGGTVRAIDGETRDTEWVREFHGSARIRHAADADNDGDTEVFVGRANGNVVALSARTGETRWTTTVTTADRATVSSPVLGDVTGDGNEEVVATARDGTVSVLDAESGEQLGTYERSVPILTFPTVADTDGDDAEEILARYGDGRVVALDYD